MDDNLKKQANEWRDRLIEMKDWISRNHVGHVFDLEDACDSLIAELEDSING